MNIIDIIRQRHNLTPDVIKRYLNVFNIHLKSVLKDGIRTDYEVYKTRKCAIIKVELSENGNEGFRIQEHTDHISLFATLGINDFLPYLNNETVNVIIKDNSQIIIVKDFSSKVWNVGCARNDVLTIVNGGL